MDNIEFPVDYFHGRPDISLPLYTLKFGNIEIPIVLSYQSGGVRADQKIGNAGLGWTLNCGASISHTVYGAPDDATGTMHGLWHLDSQEQNFRQGLLSKTADYDPTDGAAYRDKLYWEAIDGKRYYEGRTDVANDLFQVYGLGLSATFTVLPDKRIVKTSDKPVEIERFIQVNKWMDGGCDDYGFNITDSEGLTYQFSTQERTKYEFSYGDPQLELSSDSIYYASSWHIDKITDLNGNSIKFHYTPGKSFIVKYTAHPVEVCYSNNTFTDAYPYHTFNSIGVVKYFTQNLQRIEYAGISVEFKYAYPETDKNDAMLESITIISPDNTRRVIEFRYSGNHLSKVIDQDEVIYTFDYISEYGGGYNGDHMGQDFGGYKNETSNNHLIPYVVVGCGEIGRGGDRSVTPGAAAERSLKRINFATGGYTEFEWESNTFNYLKNLEYKGDLNTPYVTSVTTDTLRGCLEPGFEKLEVKGWRLDKGQNATLDLTNYFNMNPANLFNSEYHDTHIYDVYPEGNPPHYPHIVIRDHNTSKIVKIYYLDKNTIEPDNVKKPIKLLLSPGTYDFELKFPYSVQGAEDFIETEFRFHDSISGYIFINKVSTDKYTSEGNQNWCGLRIKRIISCAGDDENDILRKDFYYNLAKDPNATTGTVLMIPRYDYMYYKKIPDLSLKGFVGTEVYCISEAPFPQLPSGTFSNIEYPEVTTCMGREDRLYPDSYLHYFSEANIYSSSRNLSSCDFNNSEFLSFQPIGARMYTSRAHRRGNLEKNIRYNQSMPAHITEYSYNIYEDDSPEVLTSDAFPVCDFTMVPGDNTYGTYDYSIGKYSLIPYNKTLSYEEISQDDGFESFKKYDYFYTGFTDRLDYNLVKSVTGPDSEYNETKTYYTYAKGTGHYLPYPETEVTVVGSEVVSAVRTEYDRSTRLPVRKFTLSEKTDANTIISGNQQTTSNQVNLINTLTYEYRYNSRGNLIQISYKGTPLASYIWGYNGLYPILEATDTDYETLVNAALASGLTSDEINGSTTSAESKITSLSDALRQNLPESDISAISYHWLLGVAKIISPQGISSGFSYDSRGRLVEVRDFNNYLINKYEYHYENSTY